MIDAACSDETQGGVADPFPELNIFVHGGRLELLLLPEVEDLQSSRLGLERNYLLVPVHNGTVRLDRASGDIVAIFELDNHHFR